MKRTKLGWHGLLHVFKDFWEIFYQLKASVKKHPSIMSKRFRQHRNAICNWSLLMQCWIMAWPYLSKRCDKERGINEDYSICTKLVNCLSGVMPLLNCKALSSSSLLMRSNVRAGSLLDHRWWVGRVGIGLFPIPPLRRRTSQNSANSIQKCYTSPELLPHSTALTIQIQNCYSVLPLRQYRHKV